VAFIEASLEELPVSAKLGQSCLATRSVHPGPVVLGGSATEYVARRRAREALAASAQNRHPSYQALVSWATTCQDRREGPNPARMETS